MTTTRGRKLREFAARRTNGRVLKAGIGSLKRAEYGATGEHDLRRALAPFGPQVKQSKVNQGAFEPVGDSLASKLELYR
jgi:hypothetical protein